MIVAMVLAKECGVNYSTTPFLDYSEALPFFLLLIDLSKARALARFAFRSRHTASSPLHPLSLSLQTLSLSLFLRMRYCRT